MKYCILLCIVLLIAVSAKFSENANDLFEKFKHTYGRRYKTPEEESKRRQIFSQSMLRVDKNNAINGEPVFGVTKYSDWTQDEFQVLLGRKNRPYYNAAKLNDVRDPANPMKWNSKNARSYPELPAYVNWHEEGLLTPIKNQGQCGSCWAFSTAEEVESEWKFQGNYLWEFSSQQVASCTSTCNGCGGGNQILGYEYLMNVTGLGSAWFAPYTQSMYVSCLDSACTTSCSNFSMTDLKTYSSLTGPYAVVTGYSYATPACVHACEHQNTSLLAINLATYGPVSIDVNAALWVDYVGGVLTQTACGGYAYRDLDHAVQLVGYNSKASSPYWIVRNSWATNWGEAGFIYLEYPANTCGLADSATFVQLGNSQANFTA